MITLSNSSVIIRSGGREMGEPANKGKRLPGEVLDG